MERRGRTDESTDESTWLVLDDTTIYEIDEECYRCMSEEERYAAGFGWLEENRKKR